MGGNLKKGIRWVRGKRHEDHDAGVGQCQQWKNILIHIKSERKNIQKDKSFHKIQ